MALLAVLVTVTATTPTVEMPDPYWARVGGCDHGHRRTVAELGLERLLRNHSPLTARRREHATHLRRCVLTRRDRRAVGRHWRALRRWRMSYPHAWPIRFHRLPDWAQGWALNTSHCEARQAWPNLAAMARLDTGNGYLGAFQWLPSTWYAAGGDRWPTLASWHHQATIAVRLMFRDGAGHWPVCG
jgi:hypothetical protein